MSSWFYWRKKTLFLHIHLQPQASRDEIIGIHGNHLKIRISAPPIEGRANKYLIKFLAKCFGVPQTQVSIEKGKLGRIKTVRIEVPKDISALTQWVNK